jgi:VWFA-related protein
MLRAKTIFPVLMMIGLIAVLWLPAVSHAQTPSELIINYPEISDVDGALQLGLYFTITDSAGRVVPDAKVQSARIQLDDGERADPAQVEQPTTPFYIVLVLDASGSMGGAAEAMRQAAIQAINDSPEEALFAVIRFNDQIDLLQDFTEDRNSAINAIGDVVPRNLAGTCLYDATYEAIDLMSDAPPGRRAIIVFTDGKDETAQGEVCSRHTLDEMVEYANARESRVPIHTIGLSTQAQNINAGELRNIAGQTGGLSAIGEQDTLNTLFQEIMDALKSQWLATGQFYPTAGPHTATLTVTLEDGTLLSAVTTFEVPPPGYQVPITPTFTPTPVIVDLEILTVTSDFQQEMIFLEVIVRGESVISEYRFDFFDADTNQLLDRFLLPAPLTSPVAVPADNLGGDIRVELRVLDRSGNIISWPGERDELEDKVTYPFSYIRPTPTPPPATWTVVPIIVELNSIAYNQVNDTITLDLSLIGQEQMSSLEITMLDADTNLRVNVYNTEPVETVELGAAGLVPGKEYAIYVIAQNATGQNLNRSNTQEFVYSPLLTPTPTATATPTRTPTPSPVQVSIASIDIDEATQEIVVGIYTEDFDRIESFKLQLRNSQTGLVVGEYERTPPLTDTIRIPLSNVPAGEYTAVLRAFATGGVLVAEASPLNFAYSPPPTPTPVPTETPTPTPSPTPEPGFTERIGDAVRDNPALALVVAVVGFALIVLLFVLLRPRKKQATGTGFLSAQTGAYQVAPPSAPSAKAPEAKHGDAATMMAPIDAEKTDVFPGALPPLATLRFDQSPDVNRVGESVPVSQFPFKIGRGTTEPNDLRLDEDTSISRRHATITFENGAFYVTDENSSNGTGVDGKRLMPRTPTVLRDGSHIMLGKGTVLTFQASGYGGGSGGDDPDKTDYVRLNTLR